MTNATPCDWLHLRLEAIEDAQWRHSRYTACSWIQLIWTEFCVISASRIFPSARTKRILQSNLKVYSLVWLRHHLCTRVGIIKSLIRPKINKIVTKCDTVAFKWRIDTYGHFCASVRITHTAEILLQTVSYLCVAGHMLKSSARPIKFTLEGTALISATPTWSLFYVSNVYTH